MHKAQREVYETKTYFACLHKGWAKKTDHFWQFITPVYDNFGRVSIHKNIQLLIRTKSDISNVTIFKYS